MGVLIILLSPSHETRLGQPLSLSPTPSDDAHRHQIRRRRRKMMATKSDRRPPPQLHTRQILFSVESVALIVNRAGGETRFREEDGGELYEPARLAGVAVNDGCDADNLGRQQG
ncbi:hypothetical protein U1Q18_009554 [Sarracenia purpurea var. burkii]